MNNRLKILVCSLNWGIGHSSRMIPLIRALLKVDAEVILASAGKAGELLRTAFPRLSFHELPSVNIRYSKKRSQAFLLALQVPRLLILIFREHRWLRKFIRTEPVDIVISDNCYGLFNRKILSVFVSHQLSPALPAGFLWMETFVRAMLGVFIQSFDRCWIPDSGDSSVNLTGRLSHRYPVFRNARFMGILSRFCDDSVNIAAEPAKKYDILVIMSGPEPQRTLMEELLTGQLAETSFKTAIICGIQQPCCRKNKPGSKSSVDYYYHLPSDQFRETMRNAAVIICRAGYSTIMDLAELGLSAILVPTPGQPEQEYLAGYLNRQGFFHSIRQQHFSLQAALQQYHSRQRKPPPVFHTQTGNYLDDLLTLYEKKKIDHTHPQQETCQNLQS